MVEVAFSSTFRKVFNKHTRKNKLLEKKFWEKLEVFITDPFHSSLRTHKLSGRLDKLWSYSVDYDCRVIFYFDTSKKVVFIDIGTHDEVY